MKRAADGTWTADLFPFLDRQRGLVSVALVPQPSGEMKLRMVASAGTELRTVKVIAEDEVNAVVEGVKWSKDMREQLKTMQRDVVSLTDHSSYLSNKITFALDAMLGVVNLEQNNIIKLFSVMAVVLMPPTLIASIYGMNFKAMPELEWAHGYPMALVMMLMAAVLPYFLFKWKKWL